MIYRIDDVHAPSLLPDGRSFDLVWQDEFDGDTLDRTKWDYRLHMMGRRHVTWQDDGVSLDGHSNAVFRIYEKDGEVCSSQLQTGYNFMDYPLESKPLAQDNYLFWTVPKFRESLFLYRYGYCECRCRLQQLPGWWSAFWCQSPTIGSDPDFTHAGIEYDIMESFHPGECSQHANHHGGYGPDHGCRLVGEGAKDLDREAFHYFGMLWTPEGCTFYIDGKEDGFLAAPVSQRSQFLLISTEVCGYRTPAHTATPEAHAAAKAGDTFLVDFVRVYKCKD